MQHNYYNFNTRRELAGLCSNPVDVATETLQQKADQLL